MEQIFVVTDVRRYVKTATNSNLKFEGWAIDFVELNTQQEGTLFRNPKQVLIDLEQSFRIEPNPYTTFTDTKVANAMRRIKGKQMFGDITFHKAGETYTVPETSAKYKETGKTEHVYNEDGWHLEGFLDIKITEEEDNARAEIEMVAERLAEIKQRSVDLLAGTRFGKRASASTFKPVGEGEGEGDTPKVPQGNPSEVFTSEIDSELPKEEAKAPKANKPKEVETPT